MSTKFSTLAPSTGLRGLNGLRGCGLSSSIKMTRHARTPYYSNSQLAGIDHPALHRCPKTRVLNVYSQNRPRQEDTSVVPQVLLSRQPSRQQHYKSRPKFFHRPSDTMHIPYATTKGNQQSSYHPSLCSRRRCPLPQS